MLPCGVIPIGSQAKRLSAKALPPPSFENLAEDRSTLAIVVSCQLDVLTDVRVAFRYSVQRQGDAGESSDFAADGEGAAEWTDSEPVCDARGAPSVRLAEITRPGRDQRPTHSIDRGFYVWCLRLGDHWCLGSKSVRWRVFWIFAT